MSFENTLDEILGSENILKNEPMKNHTSFRIGGLADYFLIVNTEEKLKKVLELCKLERKKFFIIGNGTNLLVSDKGIRGIVIKLDFNNINLKVEDDKYFINVGAGYPIPKLSKFALENELTGLEFATGIPGTVGGAIRMNAGAYGGEIKDLVVETKYMDYEGNINIISNEAQKFSYRNSIFSKMPAIILETTLKLKKGNSTDIKSKMEENKKNRIEKQPLEYPNAGSAFKRKEGIVVAKLIDEAGLKGYSIGDAQVSTKHAGFLINKGNSSFDDMKKLINYVQKKVLEKFNIEIELEILILGE